MKMQTASRFAQNADSLSVRRSPLAGEMIRNQLVTDAANEISQADPLLVLGCTMDSMLAQGH